MLASSTETDGWSFSWWLPDPLPVHGNRIPELQEDLPVAFLNGHGIACLLQGSDNVTLLGLHCWVCCLLSVL